MSAGYPFMIIEHGSAMWHRWRLGKITASRFLDVMAIGTSSPWGAPAITYAEELALEIITGEPKASFSSLATDWGNEWEHDAREAYILKSGRHVPRPNRVYYRPGTLIGGTPDGLVGDDGGMEIKCPKSRRVHFHALHDIHKTTGLRGIIPPMHIPQVMGYMWLTGRDWWDFVSFDPRFPEDRQLHVFRVMRPKVLTLGQQDYITTLSQRAYAFQDLVLGILRDFGHKGDPLAEAAEMEREIAALASQAEEAEGKASN